MAIKLNLNPDFGLSVNYRYQNIIKRFYRGNDYINAQWEQPLASYSFKFAVFRQTFYNYLLAFFDSVNGSQDIFLWQDPLDYRATKDYFDSNRGIITRGQLREYSGEFQMVKRYAFGSGVELGIGAIERPITRPDVGTVKFYNTLGDEVTGDITADPVTGRVTGSLADASLRWEGEFFVPCRFANERLPIEIITYDPELGNQEYRIPDLRIIEVRDPSLYPPTTEISDVYTHNFSLPQEYGSPIDQEFLTDIYTSDSGFEDRDDLDSNRRKLGFTFPWLTEEDKEYLIGLWRICLGTYSGFRFVDTDAFIDNTFRFDSDISFQTLSHDTIDNISTYSANSVELIEELSSNKSAFCHLWKINKKDGSSFWATDHDRLVLHDGVLWNPDIGLKISASPKTAQLNTDNVDAQSVFLVTNITENELITGQLDDARIEHYLYSWTNKIVVSNLFIGNIGSYSIGYIDSAGKQYSFESLSTANKLNLSNSVNTSSRCPFRFLDQGGSRNCNRAIDSSVRESGTVISATLTEITTGLTATLYVLGKIRFTSGLLAGKEYFIGDADGGIFKLMFALPIAPNPGDSFEVTRHCDKTTDACNSYGNLVNYGGFPLMPLSDLNVTPSPVGD